MIARTPRNWIVHDYLQVNGGAERLVGMLAEHLPYAALAVSGIHRHYRAGHPVSDTSTVVDLGRHMGWLPRVPRALLTFSRRQPMLRGAEWVIYSGIYAPLAAVRQKGGRRLLYCHTPPRFAFDRCDEYLQRAPAVVRPLLRLSIARYRSAYLRAVRAMDDVLVNSSHVRERLRQQTGVEARVVYPPVDTGRWRCLGQGGYYLSVGRLEPNKRIDRIVQAFLTMPEQKLIVASGGSELDRLRRLAGGASNIEFTGWLDDDHLAERIGRAIAVIYIPRDEDFGMSAIEAMAAGKPVIGVNEGGLGESVIDGHTGVLLPANPSPAVIAGAVRRLSASAAAGMRPACEARAREFSAPAFIDAIRALIG